jgi:cytochrome d ubiquinol oxidase subunit II
VVTGAHLAAVYLAADADRGGYPDLAERFRMRALGSGVAAGTVAIGGLLVVREDARALYDGLTGEGAAFVAFSALGGVGTLALLWVRRHALARLTAPIAVAAIVVGWAAAQAPDLLPGELTVGEAAAPSATLLAVLVGGGIGMLVLVPCLWYLLRLRFRGSLDKATPVLARRADRP